MLVRELMTPKPVVVAPEMPVPEALSLMRGRKIHQLPVVDNKGKLVGVVTEQDLLHASASSVSTLSVWELPTLLAKITVEMVMVKNVYSVTGDTPVEEAARIMSDKGIGCLPVVDKDTMIGLVTKSDLFLAFMELLGGRRTGVRIWAQTPDAKGTVAKITNAIAAVSGNIVGLGFNEIRDVKGSRWEITLKVQDVPADKLVEAIKPIVIEIKDVRES
ncbi:MAG TPA: CBS and ACT domain-containing protein [Holophaga sp.]|nr:CBS and ACT domain-containing protein [Holophaga sp.]HPS67452.1 CBS and ACT domain-containing protein [Holophaga sp.]